MCDDEGRNAVALRVYQSGSHYWVTADIHSACMADGRIYLLELRPCHLPACDPLPHDVARVSGHLLGIKFNDPLNTLNKFRLRHALHSRYSINIGKAKPRQSLSLGK